MDYKRHYNLLIERAKNRSTDGYVERHHIIPRCLGGNDDTKNIVNLTPEEHYVAHQLLVKIYPTNERLIYAANMMTVDSSTTKRSNNKRYGWLKQKYINICRKRIGKNNPSYGKSWYHCPDSGTNGKFLEEDVPEGWVKGRVKVKYTSCSTCGVSTGKVLAQWCDACRPKKKQTVIKNTKTKDSYTEEEKIKALLENNGSIRQALFSLGLNDSGTHYRKMKELKSKMPS